ncbi:hypothetical protein LCGC14_0398790 [marine sediment metagenome]|uniref:Murein endopeptidase K n=1 Tax=marine sediment metagenome TaxID=412755 RepID=A0A0F9W690_9ZZZZ|nr:DUF882 domain-containing protein [Candidatus Aminicenantes bacterium]
MINDIKVSRNFKLYELESPDTHEVKIDKRMLSIIQTIRDYFQKPVIITSGYRTKEHNRAVGGVDNSYHTQGKAVDFFIKGIKPKELLRVSEYCGATGLGFYRGRHFIHIDIGKRRSWVKG